MIIDSIKKAKQIASWIVFAIAIVVYYFSVERTGSLWDCGEFILGAYKLEVVHPPGAPLFMLIGRMFTWVATLISSNPESIAFSVNLMSALCTAFGAFLLARITIMLGKMALVGRDGKTDENQNLGLTFAGIASGLSMAFCTSIWFSAVEGEVYAMSTMFTVLTLWSALEWYSLPDTKRADRWLILTMYIIGLSLGVHLLSLLTLPAIGIMYYLKKYQEHKLLGFAASFAAGAAIIIYVQKIVIVGIPTLWQSLELSMVNDMGFPFHSGLVAALLIVAAIIVYLLKWANKKNNNGLQLLVVGAMMFILGFSTIGVIIIRANADTPVNMNVPSDATRVIPYLNREQYGERALLFGPHFNAQPEGLNKEDRYGIVGDKYEIVDQRLDYIYKPSDKIFLPRIGHTEGQRPDLHRQWHKALMGQELRGQPGFGYNVMFMLKYQMGWMYWRYFMWNFVGKQNAEQGFMPWDVSSGHWASGIKPIDEMRLHNTDKLTDTMRNHKGSNHYYFLPLIFGILGMFFHFSKDKKTFLAIFTLFLITGLGLILYSNQPPNEPRERDYVLVGSFFTFCIWIGLGAMFLAQLMKDKMKLSSTLAPILAGVIVLLAPLLMATQNFDDHSRMLHKASRDYASNFLNSVEKDAIIFTYGDNDTYPLWYAQEVENIRRDVRVVNLSLIFVDWYIDKLKRKVNDSPPIKLTIPSESYRGNKRHQIFFVNPPANEGLNNPRNLLSELEFLGSDQNLYRGQSFARSKNLYIPIDAEDMLRKGLLSIKDTAQFVDNIMLRFGGNDQYFSKDELAVIDVIASNIHDRPIYFAVTCKNDKLLNLNDYMQMEGLGLRLIPIKSSSVRSLSIYGSGRVAEEKVYDNVMNKWRWGNFDKHETFVDNSYAAEIQAMKIVMMRTSQEFIELNKPTEAGNMAAKYFEAFPHFNFPYDESIVPFIDVLIRAGRTDEAKDHLEILAKEIKQKLDFYNSLDESDFESFRTDFTYAIRATSEILTNAQKLNDAELLSRLQNDFADYDLSKIRD